MRSSPPSSSHAAPHTLGAKSRTSHVAQAGHVDALLRPGVRVVRVVAEADPGLVQPRLRVLAREAAGDRHVAVLDEGLDLLVGENGVGHARLPSTAATAASATLCCVAPSRGPPARLACLS